MGGPGRGSPFGYGPPRTSAPPPQATGAASAPPPTSGAMTGPGASAHPLPPPTGAGAGAPLSATPQAAKQRLDSLYGRGAGGPPQPGQGGGQQPGMQGYPPQSQGGMGGHPHGGPQPGMPAAFGGYGGGAPQHPQAPSQQQMMGMMGATSQGATPGAQQTITIDPARQAEERFVEVSTRALPATATLAEKSGLALGGVVRPLAPDATGKSELPVVDFGAAGVMRCRRCRTYINPFVQFLDGGHKWRCNVCSYVNDVPQAYYSRLDARGEREDRERRPELRRGQVEILAPAEYMVRQPQAPCFVFVIDVSYHAVGTGVVESAVAAIRDSLDAMAAHPRTEVGIITFDSAVHFYNMDPKLQQPQVLVMPNLQELFLPVPHHLMVPLAESRHLFDTLLQSLPNMYAGTRNTDTALGAALSCAHRIMQHVGGRMSVFQASLPSLGEGKLKHRENPKMLGTEQEKALLAPADEGYKKRAAEMSRVQISVDVYLFATQYTDVATLSALARHTGGEVFYYPAFSAPVDGPRFRADLVERLTGEIGFESVMRIRCSGGLAAKRFFGSFFIRGVDLLALPVVGPSTAVAFNIQHDGASQLPSSVAVVQSALLYTTASGERRIRVHTLALNVSSIIGDVINSVNLRALVTLNAKMAAAEVATAGVEAARQNVQRGCADLVRTAKTLTAAQPAYGPNQAQPPAQQPTLPASVSLLPLYAMALQKSPALRGGGQVPSDLRAYYLARLQTATPAEAELFVYPRFVAVHGMAPECGTPQGAASDRTAGPRNVLLPPRLGLTADMLRSDGAFLVDAGFELFLWVGRAAPPALVNDLFGAHSLQGVDCSQVPLQPRDNALSKQLHAILDATLAGRPRTPKVTVVSEGDRSEARFRWSFAEDRANFPGGAVSYSEYLNLVMRS